MQRITRLQTDRLRHIAQTWRGSEADLVWTMCGSEFAVSRIKDRLWHTTQDGKLIGAAGNPDTAIGHAMRVYVNQTSPTCADADFLRRRKAALIANLTQPNQP